MNEWLDLDDLLEQGHDLLEVGLHDEALHLLDRYREVFPHEVDIELLYAHIHTEQDHPEKALSHLHRGLELEGDNIDCLLGLFYSYAETGRMDEGLKYLTRAEEIAPDTEAVVGSKLWYLNGVNRFAEAIAHFEKNRHIRFENPETLRNAGCAYQRMHRYGEAEVCFKAALEINPYFHEARDLLADSYHLNGEGDKAVAVYRDFLKRSPNHVRTLSRLVFSLCQNERYDEALAEARTTIRAYPNSPVGYVDLAYVYLNKDETEKALASAARALDLAPLDAEAHRVTAIVCSEKGDDEAAEKHFAEALALEPDNAEIKRDYYHHLRNVGATEKMLDVVDEVIEGEHPYCSEDCWFLADYYNEEGYDSEAFHYLHRAYRLMPEEPELIPPMVDILLDRGRFAAASRFMAYYVRRSGWNASMELFTRHRRLRGARAQEGLRLLRFMGQKAPEFRNYLLAYYVLRFTRAGAILVGVLCLVEATVFFRLAGALAALGMAVGVAAGWAGFRFIKQRLVRGACRTPEEFPP